MRISKFIARLEELEEIAGDVEVGIEDGFDRFAVATAELRKVVEVPDHDTHNWRTVYGKNTHQIVTIW